MKVFLSPQINQLAGAAEAQFKLIRLRACRARKAQLRRDKVTGRGYQSGSYKIRSRHNKLTGDLCDFSVPYELIVCCCLRAVFAYKPGDWDTCNNGRAEQPAGGNRYQAKGNKKQEGHRTWLQKYPCPQFELQFLQLR